jgi:RimJ/RimL family protein N-acetyltransferase
MTFGNEPPVADGPTDDLSACIPGETPRLTLRALIADDAEVLVGVCDDPLIASTIPFIDGEFDIDDARALLAATDGAKDCFFGVWLRENGKMIGVIGTHLSDGSDVEIGYWLIPKAHGSGYASEAVAAVINALETGLSQRRIVAQCRPENSPSWRLLEKQGFAGQGPDGARAGRHFLIRADGDA